MTKRALALVFGTTVFLATALGSAQAQQAQHARPPQRPDLPPEKSAEEGAREVADAWLNALSSGETAVALALSDVPFKLGEQGEKIFWSTEEMRKFCREAGRGLRSLPWLFQKTEEQPDGDIRVFYRINDDAVFLLINPSRQFRVTGLGG